MAITPIQSGSARDSIAAQEAFLRVGGLYQEGLRKHRDNGALPDPSMFTEFPQEYPKMLRISQGEQTTEHSTEDVKGKTITWKVTKEAFREIIVSSEDEEERVLAGGVTSAQQTEERQALIQRCRNAGIKVDLSWSSLRLKRELGEALDAPEPVDDMAALTAKLARLQEMADMKARIAELEAQLSGKAPDAPAEVDDLRAQLTALGVVVDKRWGAARLREELDAATAPGEEKAA